MNQALHDILSRFCKTAKTEREKGTSFENLIKDFLVNDPAYGPQFDGVWSYSDWAKSQGIDSRDTGIDFVAKLADDDTYCAIQCKFYDESHRIQKSDIDSFFTASGKKPFVRGIIVDSTRGELSVHAEAELNDTNHYVQYNRLGLIYNSKITVRDIPLEAFDYMVNGWSAIEWVVDRQCVKTDKASGIVNDANLYATETAGDAKYPLELLQRVITVSLETMKIVRSLPSFDIEVDG